MKKLTTTEAARAAKISRASLQEWIRHKKVAAPAVQLVNGRAVRLWTPRDVQKLRAIKSKIYGMGKGKKKKGEAQ